MRNNDDVSGYITRVTEGLPVIGYIERLSAAERLLERVMLGLRLCNGFDLASAETECGYTLSEIAGEAVTVLCEQELLAWEGDNLRLTPTGFPVANLVMRRLMAAREHESLTRM